MLKVFWFFVPWIDGSYFSVKEAGTKNGPSEICFLSQEEDAKTSGKESSAKKTFFYIFIFKRFSNRQDWERKMSKFMS